MIVKELYCYEREIDKITVSIEKPEGDYFVKYRLIAEVGKKLAKDGKTIAVYVGDEVQIVDVAEAVLTCIDVESIEGWYEIDYSDEISAREFMTLVEEAL